MEHTCIHLAHTHVQKIFLSKTCTLTATRKHLKEKVNIYSDPTRKSKKSRDSWDWAVFIATWDCFPHVFCVCVCVHRSVYIYMYMGAHVCKYMWKPEVDIPTLYHSPLYLTEASSLVESRTHHFGYSGKPASSGIPCLCPLSSGSRDEPPCPPS